MAKARYMQCSVSHMLNLQTFKLESLGVRPEDSFLYVPKAYWRKNSVKPGAKIAHTLRLNDMTVKLSTDTIYSRGDIWFYDERRKVKTNIVLGCGVQYTIGAGCREPYAVHYNIVDSKKRMVAQTRIDGGNPFGCMKDLMAVPFNGADCFLYGLSDKQMSVSYRGEQLGGESYVLFCGPWGILLDDEFRFDSLALFAGYSEGCVNVDKFMYTVNKYVMKIMMLKK